MNYLRPVVGSWTALVTLAFLFGASPAAFGAQSATIIPEKDVNECALHDKCNDLIEFIVKEWDRLTKKCTATNDIDKKKPYADQLLELEREIDFLSGLPGIENLVHTTNEICGGLLDETVTFIEVQPDSVRLELDEQRQLTATIHCSNGECIGELEWGSNNETVADITQEGLVSGKSLGSTVVAVNSKSIPTLLEPVWVRVGGVVADVAIVIENHFNNYYWIGTGGYQGLRQKGDLIIEGLRQYVDDTSMSALVAYNNPLVYPYNTYYYADNDEDCVSWFGDGVTISNPGITDYLAFTSVVNEPATVSAWGDLKLFCGASVPPNVYERTFVYSALMHTMDGVSLGSFRTSDPGVEKLIILVAKHPPAGPYSLDNQTNDPEALTGLTADDVIALAKSLDVKIHVLNIGSSREEVEGCFGYVYLECPADGSYEGSRETFGRLAQETGGTYQETEYPQPSASPYAGPNLYQGIVDILKRVAEEQ